MVCEHENALLSTADLSRTAARIWRADRHRKISDVVSANYRLSPETESDPGPVDLERARFWREPLDFANDARVRKITVMGSTQVAKTIFSQGAILALAEIDPAPTMYCVPTKDEARVQRDRIYGNALASEKTFSNLVPPQRLWNLQQLNFGGMRVYLAFSGSAQRLRGKPCKRVFLNEIDVYDFSSSGGNPIKAASERVKQFPDSLIWQESSPTGEDSPIFNEFRKSDQRRLHIQCPHCQCWQEVRFFTHTHGEMKGCGGVSGFRDQSGNFLDVEAARKKAHYVCVKGCRIDASFKNSMIADGRWVPIGGSVEEWDSRKNTSDAEVDSGQLGSGNETIIGSRGVRHVGYHVWTIFNPKISIGDIAAAFVEFVNDGGLREFFENWLGLRFKSGKKVASWEQVGKRYQASYPIGQVPTDVWFLTAGCDVQGDRVYYVILGWGPGRTPYLIHWGKIYQSVGKVDVSEESIDDDADDSDGAKLICSDLHELPKHVLDVSFPVANGLSPWGSDSMSVRVAGCDSNYRTMDVHDWMQSIDYGDRLCAVRGDHKVDPRERYRMNVVERNTRTGEVYEGGMEQWGIYVNNYESLLVERLAAQPGSLSALRLPMNVLPDGQEFLKQLTNKVRASVRDEQGRQKTIYKVQSTKIGVDYRDCFIYAETMADRVVGDRGWSEESWIQWRDSQFQSVAQVEDHQHDEDYLRR